LILDFENLVVRHDADRNLDLEVEEGVVEGFMFEVREDGV
jgi:hypothetical protein